MALCFLIRRKLVDFAEQNLNEGEVRKVQAHLSECGPCRQEFDLIRKGLDAAHGHRPPVMDEVFWKRFDEGLWKKIQEGKPSFSPAPFLAPLWKPAAVILPVIIVMLAVLTRMSMISVGQQEAVLVREAAWLINESPDTQVLSALEDDLTDEMEILFVLDPSLIRKIG
ncbi:MAG: zf-HC2 domain-containing protein [Candidatus Omnitrophota bacterium]